jgi:hypothetical protein
LQRQSFQAPPLTRQELYCTIKVFFKGASDKGRNPVVTGSRPAPEPPRR